MLVCYVTCGGNGKSVVGVEQGSGWEATEIAFGEYLKNSENWSECNMIGANHKRNFETTINQLQFVWKI